MLLVVSFLFVQVTLMLDSLTIVCVRMEVGFLLLAIGSLFSEPRSPLVVFMLFTVGTRLLEMGSLLSEMVGILVMVRFLVLEAAFWLLRPGILAWHRTIEVTVHRASSKA